MSISPFLNSPLTDFLFIIAPNSNNYYNNPICEKIQSKFLDCLEAYGTVRARENCAELLYDMNECATQQAQIQRGEAMRKERMKQYREGKLSKPFEEHPYLDPYLSI